MVNKAILIGNLGKDPELTYTPSGAAVCKMTLATNERWTDNSGEKRERTEWHNLVLWRKQAEIANEFLRKGSKIYVEGRIQTRSWEGNDGQKRYMTEIVVQNFQMLGSRGEGGGGGGGEYRSEGGQGKSQGGARQRSRQQQGGEPHYEPIDENNQGGPDESFGGQDDEDLPF